MWKFGISPDKFIADCVDLSDDEIGKYFRLLCHAWKNEAHLIDDKKRINAIVKNPNKESIDYILKRFFKKDNIGYYCPAQLEEWEWVKEKSEKSTAAINKRWNTSYDYLKDTNVLPSNSNNNNNKKFSYTEDFLKVWNSLNIKVGSKRDGQHAFNKIKNVDPDILIKKYNFYLSTVDDPKYYKHFSAWLNSERYEEDLQLGESQIRKMHNLDTKDHKYLGFIDKKHKFVYDMVFSKMTICYDGQGNKLNG